MVRKVVPLALGMLFFSTALLYGGPAPMGGKYFNGPDYEGVIFPADASMLRVFTMEPGTACDLTEDEAKKADGLAAAFLAQARIQAEKMDSSPANNYWLASYNRILWDLPRYRRQYYAYTGVDGHKIVWINYFFHAPQSDSFPEWETQPVVVDDGGSAFFNLKVDLTESRVFDVMVNGVA